MPDDPTLTITLSIADWQVILAGLAELPIKHGIPTLNRLQQALAEAQKPPAALKPLPELKPLREAKS